MSRRPTPCPTSSTQYGPMPPLERFARPYGRCTARIRKSASHNATNVLLALRQFLARVSLSLGDQFLDVGFFLEIRMILQQALPRRNRPGCIVFALPADQPQVQ